MVTLEDLKNVGFEDKVRLIPKRSIVSIEGLEKSGKTRLALTAPEPIVYIDLDVGTEGVIEPLMQDKNILLYQVEQPSKLGSPAELMDRFKNTWADIQNKINQVLQLEKGTLVIDTFTEAYDICRMAHLGKLAQVQPHQYQVCYADLREIFRLAYKSSINLIVLHKMNPNFNTGILEYKGWNDVSYQVQTTIRTNRDNSDKGPEFSATVQDCRQKPELMGRKLEGPSLKMDLLLNSIQSGT
jgi:hypothetical protein